MSTILIRDPLAVATMDDAGTEFSGGHILIENGVIRSIGPEPVKTDADEVIDAGNCVALPGLVNTHHHFYQTLTRNIPAMQDVELFPWLEKYYELWRELDAEAFEVSARLALLELMQSGVSTSSDHLYLFPERAGGKLIDLEIGVARDLGMRFHPTRGSMSRGHSNGGLPPDDVVQSEDVIMQDCERLLKRYHEESPGAITTLALAPCSPFSVTEKLMRWTAEYARDNGLQIHTHLAETLDEEKYCLTHYGRRPLEYANSLGWLAEHAWYAHAIHLNDDEVRRMGKAGTGVSHCPGSNMRLGSGVAPIREMLDRGVRVSLAVDGSASNDSSDLLLEARNAMLLSRMRPPDYWLSAREVLRMATRGGAEVLGRSDIGRLEAGKRADIALFDMGGIGQAGSLSDPVAALVFTTRSRGVDTLLIDGRIRVLNGELPEDPVPLVQLHNAIAARILDSAQQHTGIDFRKRAGEL